MKVERQVRQIAKSNKDPSDPISEYEIEKKILHAKNSGHVKFLEMLCILENSIVDLESKDEYDEDDDYVKLSAIRNELIEKREAILVLVDSIF